jgi:transposase
LVTLYYSGVFVHHEPFIAYLGLDVRTKDSGQMRGKRRLTKRAEGEFRRLLFLAAMAASRTRGYFATRYQALRSKGHASTAAYIIIARKIATVAFNLLRLNVDFDPLRLDKPKRSSQVVAAQ